MGEWLTDAQLAGQDRSHFDASGCAGVDSALTLFGMSIAARLGAGSSAQSLSKNLQKGKIQMKDICDVDVLRML